VYCSGIGGTGSASPSEGLLLSRYPSILRRPGQSSFSRRRRDQRHGGYQPGKRPAHRWGRRKSGRSWAKQYPFARHSFSFHSDADHTISSARISSAPLHVQKNRNARDVHIRPMMPRSTGPARQTTLPLALDLQRFRHSFPLVDEEGRKLAKNWCRSGTPAAVATSREWIWQCKSRASRRTEHSGMFSRRTLATSTGCG
jgi:hypothetical protein